MNLLPDKKAFGDFLALVPPTGTALGWGDEPMLFDVQKIKDQFGLVFDGHDFMMDHVKWTFSQV